MTNQRNDSHGGTYDKAKGHLNEAAGTIKQKLGGATGDRDLEAEGAAQRMDGKLDRAKGAVKNAADDAKQTLKAGVDKLRGRDEH